MAPRPKYAQLSDELRRDILNGVWKPGDLLPTEVEIAAKRQMSRSTVRAALTRLVDIGLLHRQAGIGTKVCQPSGDEVYDASIASMEDLVHFGLATERKVLGLESDVIDDALGAKLDLRPGSRWIKLETVRAGPDAPNIPICRTQIFFDPRYRSALDGVKEHHGLITELLLRATGIEIDTVDQVIRPVILDPDTAKLLAAEAGQPALEIVRRYQSAGTTIYASLSVHPAERFDYRITLRRHKAHGP